MPDVASPLTAAEVAAHKKISVAALRKWTREGAPTVPAGSRVRFDLQRLDAWLCERAEHKRRERLARRLAKQNGNGSGGGHDSK